MFTKLYLLCQLSYWTHNNYKYKRFTLSANKNSVCFYVFFLFTTTEKRENSSLVEENSVIIIFYCSIIYIEARSQIIIESNIPWMAALSSLLSSWDM